MMQNEKMRDFVKSLENDQLSKDQEAMLLVGKACRRGTTGPVKTGHLRAI